LSATRIKAKTSAPPPGRCRPGRRDVRGRPVTL
jgi:hypothetical protein